MDPFLDPNNPENQALTQFANNNFGADGVANSQTANQVAAPVEPSGFSVDVPEDIPSNFLSDDTTAQDVLTRREQLANQDQAPEFDPVEPGFFDDPRAEISDLLFGGPTALEQQEDALLQSQAEATGDFARDIRGARSRAGREVGFQGLTDALSDTQNKIARRRVRFREDLRRLDTDPQLRGVARQFAESRRAKLQSDATAELADLSIIEAAQSGNLERAERFIDAAVNERYRTFEVERQARLDQLNALGTKISREQEQEKQAISLALQDIQDQKDRDKEIRSLASTAAAEGASNEVVNRIINSGSIDSALSIASPYIGRLKRQQVASSLATASLNRRAKLVEMALQGDESAFDQLGAFGQSLKDQLAVQRSVEAQEAFETNVQAGVALQSRINRYSEQLNNDRGIAASTGALQSAVATGLAGTGRFGEFDAQPGGVFGIPGAINDKNDFLSTVTEMVNIAGFDNLIEYKAAGATFGALSDSEFNAIKSASGPLAALAIVDEGRVSGFSGSEQQVRSAYQQYIDELNDRLEELNESVLDDETNREIISITNL